MFLRRLFDNLVGAHQERFWYRQADCLGGFQVDDKFKPDRRLHWKITWLRSFEDTIDIVCRAPVAVEQIISVGDQATSIHEKAMGGDGGQAVPDRQSDDLFAMAHGKSLGQQDEAATWLACERVQDVFDLSFVVNWGCAKFYRMSSGGTLSEAEELSPVGSGRRIKQKCHAFDLGCYLL